MASENDNEDLKLGLLLRTFGLVDEDVFGRALDVSARSKLPVGKILIMQEVLSDASLKAAIEAQWMIRDRLLTLEEAFEAVHTARRNRWTFTDALIAFGLDGYASTGARLGELLCAAAILTDDETSIAMSGAQASGLPLGRVLHVLEKVPESVLNAALTWQHDVRLGHADHKEAVEDLKNIAAKHKPGGTRVGELLVQAGVITEKDAETAFAMSQTTDKMIGEVLIEMNWVIQPDLDSALLLQKAIRADEIALPDAVRVLKKFSESGRALPEDWMSASLTDLERNLTLYDFLKLSGFFTPAKLSKVVETLANQPQLLKQYVGISSERSIKDAIKEAFKQSEALSLILEKVYPDEQALVIAAQDAQTKIRSGKRTIERSMVEFAIEMRRHQSQLVV